MAVDSTCRPAGIDRLANSLEARGFYGSGWIYSSYGWSIGIDSRLDLGAEKPEKPFIVCQAEQTGRKIMTDSVHIVETAPPEAPMDLLLQADPSISKVKGYLNRSRCFIATLNEKVVGICVVQPISPGVHELMNISVAPSHQKMGIGGKLLRHVTAAIREAKASRLEVGTGTFGYQLAFYQREGFRVDSIDKDFFLLNYEEPIYENGIQLKDMLRLVLTFTE